MSTAMAAGTAIMPITLVRHARARGLRLRVDPATGAVTLTIPARASARAALRWAEHQRAWIDAERARLPRARPFVPGATVPLEGGEVMIDHDPARPRTPRLGEGVVMVGGPGETLARRVEAWLKRRALAALSDDTARYAASASVGVTRVAVGDPRGRWGSCAASGVIRYSWRLILAPVWVRHATVAHEVAHRIEMNHGPDFHALHRRLLGDDPAPARAWLRAHGAALHWVGRDSS